MIGTMKKNTFPEGMALVETADGRWFPACAFLSEIPHRIEVMEGTPLIPPALRDLCACGGTRETNSR